VSRHVACDEPTPEEGRRDIVKCCGSTPHWRRTPMGCA
jgi:hypothetical protein